MHIFRGKCATTGSARLPDGTVGLVKKPREASEPADCARTAMLRHSGVPVPPRNVKRLSATRGSVGPKGTIKDVKLADPLVSIQSMIPNAEDLLALEPEELAGVLLVHLNSYDEYGQQQPLHSCHPIPWPTDSTLHLRSVFQSFTHHGKASGRWLEYSGAGRTLKLSRL